MWATASDGRPADPGAAVAVVIARSSVELVGIGPAVEVVVARPSVAGIFAGAHVADIVTWSAPATVAARARFAEVIARAAKAFGVLRPGDADVVAAGAFAAVGDGPFRVAGVGLVVADEFVGAGAQVGGEGNRKWVEDFDLVVGGAHVDFDPVDPRERAEEGVLAVGEAASDLPAAIQKAVDDDVAAAHRQLQMRARIGAMDDDLALGRGAGGGDEEHECRDGHSRRQLDCLCLSVKHSDLPESIDIARVPLELDHPCPVTGETIGNNRLEVLLPG